MSNNHLGERSAPIKNCKALVSHEIEAPGGTIQNTEIITPKDEVKTTTKPLLQLKEEKRLQSANPHY